MFNVDLTKPLIMLSYFALLDEHGENELEMKILCESVLEFKNAQIIATYPNADAGGRIINETLDNYAKELNFLKVYPHIERRDFLGLMNICDVMVGNSSAGIVELPSFKKPFVYIGTRQKNRLKTENVIDVGYSRDKIIEGIKRALYDEEFRKKLKSIKNPYGNGKASSKIVKIISEILDGKL